MISDEPVNLSAVALEDMQVCFIPKSEVMVLWQNNQFSMNVMKSICGDLKEQMITWWIWPKKQSKKSWNAALSKYFWKKQR
jgi:hypothetical protein